MESQMFNQWVQAQIPEASQQNAVGVVPQHETARSDDWSKERSQSMANLTGTGLTDLNEFTTLADLPGECANVVAKHESCRGFRHDPYCSYVIDLTCHCSFQVPQTIPARLRRISTHTLTQIFAILPLEHHFLWRMGVHTYPYPRLHLFQFEWSDNSNHLTTQPAVHAVAFPTITATSK
jgi:hypothetical protein